MKNQKGFTLVEGLLVIIALSLIGFTGFYVYSANQKSNKPNANQSHVDEHKDHDHDKDGHTKQLQVPELGIKIYYDENLGTNLQYRKDGNLGAVKFFNDEIIAAAKKCTTDASLYNAAGILSVNKVEGSKVNTDNTEGFVAKQFESFAIVTSGILMDGGSCMSANEADSKAFETVLNKYSEQLRGVLSDSELL